MAAIPAVHGAMRSPDLDAPDVPVSPTAGNSLVQIDGTAATILIALYFFFLVHRGAKLIKAWRRTRAIKASAHSIEASRHLQRTIEQCQLAIGTTRSRVVGSAMVPVPMAVGFRSPLVILPDQLLRQDDPDVLTSAIGHELVHVWRRDYLLNLIYELLYLPLSFHPAAALVRRRINQTRELVCDELVTEKLLAAEVYAHSLVRLAGAAVPFGRDATLTVGITDADILEVRIMSLLRRPKLTTPRRKLLLIAVSLLLAVPCVAAASFGLRFDINSPAAAAGAGQETRFKESSPQEWKTGVLYRAEPEYTEDARANKIEGSVWMAATIDPNGSVQDVKVTKPLYPSLDESAVTTLRKWRFEPAIIDGQPTSRRVSVEMVFNLRSWEQGQEKDKTRTRQEMEEKQRAEEENKVGYSVRTVEGGGYEVRSGQEMKEKLRAELENSAQYKETSQRAERDPQFRAELEERARHQQEEPEMEAKRDAELTRRAKLSMDQAIQIATSQQPGKVLECSLVGEHWEAPGKLANDGLVLYHVVILSGDEASPIKTHLLINAVDGSLFRSEKEKRREPK